MILYSPTIRTQTNACILLVLDRLRFLNRNKNANGFKIYTAHLKFWRYIIQPKQAFRPGAEDHSGSGELLPSHPEMLLKLHFVKLRKRNIISHTFYCSIYSIWINVDLSAQKTCDCWSTVRDPSFASCPKLSSNKATVSWTRHCTATNSVQTSINAAIPHWDSALICSDGRLSEILYMTSSDIKFTKEQNKISSHYL